MTDKKKPAKPKATAKPKTSMKKMNVLVDAAMIGAHSPVKVALNEMRAVLNELEG